MAKSRLAFTPEQRDRIVILLLVVLGLLAFPLLGSILTHQNAPARVDVSPSITTPTGTPFVASAVSTGTPEPTQTATPTRRPTGTATALPRVSPTFPPRVYLAPFRQVFIANPSNLSAAPALLYENGSDVFRVVERQGAYVRLQTLDGGLSLWTAEENIALNPPPAPQYDFSVRGKIVGLAGAAGLACPHQGNASPPLDPCESLFGISSATLTAHITTGPVSLYLADVNGKTYFLLPEAGTLGPT